MADEAERKTLTIEEADALMASGPEVHTFRQAGPALVGCDWKRSDLLALMKKYPPELSGPAATSAKHGLALIDDHGPLFIATKG